MYTVAVSYLEWIRWVATGWFRCADRVVWVEGTDDQPGIDALLDRTPDLQVADDQGYVIACLRSDSLIPSRISDGSARSDIVGSAWQPCLAFTHYRFVELVCWRRTQSVLQFDSVSPSLKSRGLTGVTVGSKTKPTGGVSRCVPLSDWSFRY